jgi:phage I-like protein
MNPSWHKLVPIGEFPHPSGVTQVIDRRAVNAMAAGFDPYSKALVDFDHYSDLLPEDRAAVDKLGIQFPSAAAGWVTTVEPRDDGLWGSIDWTGAGAAALLNKEYRFLSPVWLRSACERIDAGRLRPISLEKLGLTNEPNIRAIPALCNRDDAERISAPAVCLYPADTLANRVPSQTPAQAAAPAEPGTEHSPETGGKESTIMDFKAELLAMLGLYADATDEQISSAVAAKKAKDAETATKADERDAMTNRATAAEAKLLAFETAALAAQVEADLQKHAGKIVNREQWKKALLANRAGALELLEALPEPTQRVLNRRDARPPESLDAESRLANRRNEQDQAVDRIMSERRCRTRAEAWEIASHQNPELFG